MLLPYAATYGLRLVAPLLPEILWRGPSRRGRVAYLTFDDGPTPEMTAPLLDLLARHDARVTFFVIGAHAERHPALVQAMVDAGHTLGNHTFTHPDAWRAPAAQVVGELAHTTTFLEDLIEEPLRLLRPPYGHLTPSMLRWSRVHEQRIVMWDVMPGDFLSDVTASFVERFVRHALRPGSVIVLHDNSIARDVTLPALKALLPALTAEGWRFEAL